MISFYPLSNKNTENEQEKIKMALVPGFLKFLFIFFPLMGGAFSEADSRHSFLWAAGFASDSLAPDGERTSALPGGGKPSGSEILVFIPKGMAFQQVARLLWQKGVIKSVFYFRLLAWIKNKENHIKYGEYAFLPHSSAAAVLKILVEGKSRLYAVTFPEGLNLFEMAQVLEDQGFLKKEDFISVAGSEAVALKLLKEKQPGLEGYLFPDTYLFPRPVEAEVVVQTQVQRFFDMYARLRPEQKDLLLPLSRHEQVTLASIIEKETGTPEERPVIASVFYNRLIKKMRLESDPTIIYGMVLESGGAPVFNIKKRDIRRKTAYNTYTFKGFPPGPVANPGFESLKAVFSPASTSFLYFVSKGDGSHVFSTHFKDHKKAVDKYQRKK